MSTHKAQTGTAVVTIELNLFEPEIIDSAITGFTEANFTLGTEFQKRITDEIWTWHQPTKRRRGTAGSPRNIVDTTELRDSYRPTPGDMDFLHKWAARHALPVHEGALDRDGHTLAARPWTRLTLREVNFETMLDKAIERVMKRKGLL